MEKRSYHLSRSQKILLTLYELSGGKKKHIKFEDLAVALFKNYPDEFHLPGYPKYPDTGESVHRPLYKAKEEGLVSVGNKIFSLTDHGLTIVERLKGRIAGRDIVSPVRFSRYVEKEISRIELLESFKLFLKGEKSKIFDTDFYNYLGVTARTEKKDFLGRLETVKEAMKEIKSFERRKPIHDKILDFHEFIINKFKNIIDYYQGN